MGQVIGFDNYVNLRRFPHGSDPLSLIERKGVTSTSRRPQQGRWKNPRAEHFRPDCLVDVLSEREFRARFRILDTILIQLIDDETLSFDDFSNNMVYFTKE